MRPAAAVFLVAALVFVGLVLAERWEELDRLRDQVRDFPWRADPGWLTLATVSALCALGVTAAVWVRLFRSLGERISYVHGLAAWFGSNLGRYVPGKVWQLSGLAVYLRGRGHSATAALSSAVVAQALTLLTGVAGGALLGLERLSRAAGSLIGLAALVLLLGLLAHPTVVRRATAVVARWLGEESARGVAVPARELLWAGVAMLGTWALYGLGFWCFLRGLVGPEATPSLVASTGIFAASYLVGYLVLVAPGGLVVREGAMAALLAGLAGQPAAAAAAVALAARVWVTVAELVGAGLSLALAGGRTTGGGGRAHE